MKTSMPTSTSTTVQRTREHLGQVGVWLGPPTLGIAPAAAQRSAAARIEAAGYGSLWGGEAINAKEAFAQHSILLAATESLIVGTGIANLWARHGSAMQGGASTLAEAYPGRFILGVGVSHPHQAARAGYEYGRPLQRMNEYLDQMEAAAKSPFLAEPFPFVLAALGPKMLEVARDRADGAHPFLSPVEHTARARQILGPDKLLIPHQAVVLEPDPAQARATARANLAVGQAATSVYGQNFKRLGYTDEDLSDGFSDRLIDAIVAWGDEAAIARRIQEHLDAGADHVLVHPITSDHVMTRPAPQDVSTAADHLERLAPALPISSAA
jgi:probable F420-dependent oxidoreductase